MSKPLIDVKLEHADVVAQIIQNCAGEVTGAIRINKQAGVAVAALVRAHLRDRNSAVKRESGWEPSNYWAMAAESVYSTEDTDGATVHIPWAGVAWHRYGGEIKPRNAKALAIPLRPENKGVYPSKKFPNKGDAFVWRGKNAKSGNDAAFLATSENGELTLHYILLKAVSKDPDPTVLPSDSDILSTAVDSHSRLLASILRRKGATA